MALGEIPSYGGAWLPEEEGGVGSGAVALGTPGGAI